MISQTTNRISDPGQNSLPEYLTVKDVQKYLNISVSKAYQLSHRKDFPVCRIGGTIRIPRNAFFCWVEEKSKIPEHLLFVPLS